MSEMIVETPIVKSIVDDYDIVSINGMMLPITINPTLGDTIEFGDTKVIARLTSKPSLNDPKKILPAETITVYAPHIFSIQHRTREVLELTPEQRFAWDQTIQEMTSSSVH